MKVIGIQKDSIRGLWDKKKYRCQGKGEEAEKEKQKEQEGMKEKEEGWSKKKLNSTIPSQLPSALHCTLNGRIAQHTAWQYCTVK